MVIGTLSRLNSQDLTRDQLDKITAMLGWHQKYLNALCDRMHERKFPPQDKLYLDAMKARDAIQALRMTVHYLGCKGQVG